MALAELLSTQLPQQQDDTQAPFMLSFAFAVVRNRLQPLAGIIPMPPRRIPLSIASVHPVCSTPAQERAAEKMNSKTAFRTDSIDPKLPCFRWHFVGN